MFLGAFNVAWEIDLWGRIRRSTEVAQAQYLANDEARRGVVVTLVSEVASNYFQLLELDRELAIAHESAETYRQTLDVFTKRYRGGTDTKISTSRAEANLQASLSTIAALERQIAQQENAISVLLGTNPRPIERGMPLVDQPVPVTPLGLTSELLRRRPDIRQAEQTMIGANAGIGVAVANFFPTIGLSTLYGGASNKIGNVVKDSASLWNIAANLSGPIFQGGRLLESYYAQKAFWDETIASYRGTIVAGVQGGRRRARGAGRGSPSSGRRRRRRCAALRERRAAVARAVRHGAHELHRGARCRGAALPGRERARPDAARSARRGREPLQGARRRLADAGRAGRSAMISSEDSRNSKAGSSRQGSRRARIRWRLGDSMGASRTLAYASFSLSRWATGDLRSESDGSFEVRELRLMVLMRSALTHAGTLSPILGFLARVGVSVDRVLATAKLPPWITADSEALIPATSPVRIFGAAAPDTDIPNLGLTVGERTRPSTRSASSAVWSAARRPWAPR